MSRHAFLIRGAAMPLVGALALAACRDEPTRAVVGTPRVPAFAAVAVACHVASAPAKVSCTNTAAAKGHTRGAAIDAARALSAARAQVASRRAKQLIIGGQKQFVDLIFQSAAFDAGTRDLTVNTSVQNLLQQPMGTVDGQTVTATGVQVFFATGPSPSPAGPGTVTVVNPDGMDTFIASLTPFFQYVQVLLPNEVSQSRPWIFHLDPTVTSFDFTMFVAAQLPDETDTGLFSGPHGYETIAVGGSAGCAIRVNTTLYCWGDQSNGQLADGRLTKAEVPVEIGLSFHPFAIAAGSEHLCVLRADSLAFCGGTNSYGQLGRGDEQRGIGFDSVRVAVKWRMIAAGGQTTCGITSSRNLMCWGRNDVGQVGDGSTTNANTPVAIALPGGVLAESIAMGDHHACAVGVDSGLYCWGGNERGQLGIGAVSLGLFHPVFTGNTSVTRVSLGREHTCAIAGTFTFCWGRNAEGQVGVGGPTQYASPQIVAVGAHTDIAAGGNTTCAVRTDNTAECWGANDVGQVGNATFTDRLTPAPVDLGRQYRAIAVGDRHTCAIRGGGVAVDCWGDNLVGELADPGVTRFAMSPNTVPTSADAYESIVAGTDFTCALSTVDHDVYCWGRPASAPWGFSKGSRDFPLGVFGGIHFAQVAIGEQHACGITDDGEAWCWGSNAYGQLGSGGTGSFSAPVPVDGGNVFRAIAAGRAHTCAISDFERVWCWGANRYGQLGDGTTMEAQPVPVQTSSVFSAKVITTGSDHSCVGLDNEAREIRCWGDNRMGQIGIGVTGTFVPSPAVVNVPDILLSYEVSAGGRHTCLVAGNPTRRTYCWGANDFAQLGDFNGDHSTSPVAVTGADGYDHVVAGKNHVCGWNVVVFCWGDNSAIQAGSEAGRMVVSPLIVAAGPVAAVFGGSSADHTCAISLADRSPVCWGSLNTRGQLGAQNNQTRPTLPVFPSTP